MDGATGQGPATPEPARWLIWSREHTAFWRPLKIGYTVNLDEAGRYDTAAAIKAGALPGWALDARQASALMMLAPECAPAAVLLESLGDRTQLALAAFIASTHAAAPDSSEHGPLDLRRLVLMLLEDVALVLHRPGSWEGANMAQVLTSHGYDQWQRDPACAAVHQLYWDHKSPYTKAG